MKNRAVAGDYLAIPLKRGFAVGKVVFVSNEFKNIMLVSFLARRFECVDHTQLPDAPKNSSISIYTASIGFKKRGWKVFHSVQVFTEEELRTLRRVGNEVWLRDEFLRIATKEDEEKIPIMGVDGFIRVERVLERKLSQNV